MKKILFLLCSFLASVTLFAGELTDGYEKVTDISSLTSSDKVILYCDGAEVGVSGFSGYKDANVSSDASDWVQYEVTPAFEGVLLYDSNAAQYIIQPGGNSFLYGTNNPMKCNISNGVFGGLDGTTQRYLCRNTDPTHGTFHRFYPNTSSTATTNKYPFYIYKVVEETPDIPTDREQIWQVADEGWWGGNTIASSGTYKQVGSFNHFNAYVYDGAADWQMHTYTGTFVGMDGVTYETDYIQGGTNGMKGHLMHANGICAHLKLCPQSDGWVYIAARYGMNKPVWAAKVPNAVINSGTLDYANMTPYLMPGFSEALATDTGVVMTKAMYIREDGRGLWTREGSSDATPAAIPLQLENGYTYFFWLSGSKLMLCGLHTVWGNIDIPIETDALQYTITGTNPNTAEVSGYTGDATDVVIPEKVTINGTTYSVTSIGFGAFYFCDGLTSVNIPNSVTSIGKYAFGSCYGLTSVTIGNSVTSIEKRAFEDCSGLTSVTIGNSVTSIGNEAFYGCSALASVVWNAKNYAVPKYSWYAPFYDICSQITSFTFGNEVEYIPAYLCKDMSKLTSITIPNSVTSIGDEAFYGCSGLTSLVVKNENSAYDSRNNCNAIIETATNTLIAGCQSTIIPNSVTSIRKYAFRGCSGLTSVTIPNSVTTIGDRAFYECEQLTEIRCAAKLPPRIVDEEGSIMSNNAKLVSDYNAVTLYVPCESQAAYYTNANWGMFNTIECMDENKYTVSVTCNADEGTVFGAGTYAEGTEVTLATIPNKGYEFIQWSDGNTDNPRKIVVTGDVNLAALFAKVSTAIDAVSDQPAASKTIRNGQVCILRDGKVYDIMGNQIQ